MKKCRYVTITGADDSISPSELIKLSAEFPFVEWAILYSKPVGKNRFPSKGWFVDLKKEVESATVPVMLSLHLCGNNVSGVIENGNDSFIDEVFGFSLFRRIQLNTHADEYWFSSDKLSRLIMKHAPKEFIFQWDGNLTNQAFIAELVNKFNLKNVSILLDRSHGAGVLPSEWPVPPFVEVSTGYAGGLGPQNIAAELQKITAAVSDPGFRSDYWIDMETQVRSDMDRLFDLSKVREVLEHTKHLF